MPNITPLAQNLRNNPTYAEQKLWLHLKQKQFHNLKFRRQQVIGNYIADFCCFDKRVVIELDGGQHADSESDKIRTRILEEQGFIVVRFWNNDILNNIEGVLTQLEIHLNISSP